MTAPIQDEWSDLKRLAEAATGSVWKARDGANSHFFDQRIMSKKVCVAFSEAHDAAFIAAANPHTIKRLIAAARGRLE